MGRRTNKLVYQIVARNEEYILLNNNNSVNMNNGDIFRIYLGANNTYGCFLNNVFMYSLKELRAIHYHHTSHCEVSTVMSLSLVKSDQHSRDNFQIVLHKYLDIIRDDIPNMQLCICHTEQTNNVFLDDLIERYSINYIFVKNPYFFNLGYCRNLWKYVCNSDKIMHADIDVPLTPLQVQEVIEAAKMYDIVKPYDDRLHYTIEKEKEEYILHSTLPEIKERKNRTITGGVVLFDKKVLEETGGYEEFNSYGNEDRCLDVIILKKRYSIHRIDNIIPHLYHTKTNTISTRKHYHKILRYVDKYYNCVYVKAGLYIDEKNGEVFKNNNKVNIPNNVIDANIEYNKKYNADLMLFTQANQESPVLKSKR